MSPHVCPWWGGYFLDNPIRRLLHPPAQLLGPLVTPGMTAMDFGCGMGMFSIALARLVGDTGRVVAVDLQQRMLDVLKRRARRAGLLERIRIWRCEPDSLGIDEPLDFAMAFWSAHEVPDMRRLFREAHSLLRPGGAFLVIEPAGHVTAEDFQAMIAMAKELGMAERDRPHVRLSQAVVLVKR